jgi:hypothetical protein
MEIPTRLATLIQAQSGEIDCDDPDEAAIELQQLGIPKDSEFAAVYLRYSPSVFLSSVSYEQLLDLVGPGGGLRAATEFVHSVWELPREYVCITSCEGEGCYLYSKTTEGVYDFSLADREQFVAEQPAPMASGVFAFFEWYLGPEAGSRRTSRCT